MLRLSASLLVLLAALPALANDLSAQRVAPLRQAATAADNTAQGLYALQRLYGLKGTLEELGPLMDVFEAIASDRRALPEVQDQARFFMADLARSYGRLNRADEAVARLGFVTHFLVMGGFDNEGKNGFDRELPPETELDLGASYPGKQRTVQWRKLELSGPDGLMDLASVVRPSKEVVAYALTTLDVSKDTRVVLHLGASGASRVWVDGQKVLEDKAYHQVAFDQRAVALNLRKGAHKVLVKLASDDAPLGLYLRLAGPRGELLTTVTARLPDKALPSAKAPLGAEPLPLVTDSLERKVKAGPQDGQAMADLAALLAMKRLSDSKDRRPAQLSARAAALLPKDVDVQLLAAALENENPNTRRGFLDAAAAAAPDHVPTQLAIARDDLVRGHPERALSRLRSLALRQDSAELQVLWAQAEDDLGDAAAADRRIQAARRAYPRSVAVVRAQAQKARRLDRRTEGLDLLQVSLSLRYDDQDSRRSVINELLAQGRLDDALREQERLLKLDPTDLNILARRGELLAHNGRVPEAKAVFEQAIALCPDDADTRERYGRALLDVGDKAAAVAVLEAALSLRQQNPRLKETLRVLKGDEKGFGEAYAADAKALLARPPAAGEDLEVLSERTAVRVNPNGTSSRYVQLVARAYTDRGVDLLRQHTVGYSPDRQEVSILRTRTFKADGTLVETHGESEQNLSEPWAGLYYDARARVVTFANLAPGDTVELAYRIEDAARDNLLSDYFGDLTLLQNVYPKAELSYILEAPTARPIYSSVNGLTPATATQDKQGDTTTYRWVFKDVPKLFPEPSMPGWGEASAALHVSTYKDWPSVGRYYWGLVRDQLVATDEIKKTAQELVKGIPASDELARVRAVYDFVVTKTRYVGLEFGIHGYKPYSVDRILSRKFGDCKDKASLMHALLEQLGIPSELTLLRMKRLGDIPDSPASLAIFNHAILHVPKFDLYLDGTAEFYGSSELPNDDLNAEVLVVHPNGDSHLGHARLGKASENVTDARYDIALAADGSAHVSAQSTITGLAAPDYRRAYATEATRKATFEQAWSRTFPGLSVEKVALSDLAQLEKPVELTFALQVPRYGDPTPTGYSFSPFGRSRSYLESYAALSSRRFDLILGHPWENHFKYTYALPAGFQTKDLPAEAKAETPFGSMKMKYTQAGQTLVCEGEVVLSSDRIKVADYAGFRAFLSEVDQALGRRIELVKP
jgi:tetratricopeptide (TPR) repeat protein/transglutaminase-like putative cysteine protease